MTTTALITSRAIMTSMCQHASIFPTIIVGQNVAGIIQVGAVPPSISDVKIFDANFPSSCGLVDKAPPP
jgi:hypothetical protein